MKKTELKKLIKEEIKKINENSFEDIYNFNIDVSDKYLTSLKGAPEKVNGSFNCGNNKLTSLEGSPKKVNGDFYCSYNDLTSLESAPEEVDGDFNCSNNKVKFTEEDVRKVCNVKGTIHV